MQKTLKITLILYYVNGSIARNFLRKILTMQPHKYLFCGLEISKQNTTQTICKCQAHSDCQELAAECENFYPLNRDGYQRHIEIPKCRVGNQESFKRAYIIVYVCGICEVDHIIIQDVETEVASCHGLQFMSCIDVDFIEHNFRRSARYFKSNRSKVDI